MEIINVEQGTQEWHDLRAKYYKTASRTPIVCGVSPFQTKEQLAMELRGEYKPFYNKAMQLGNQMEDEVRQLAEIKLNDNFKPMVGIRDGYLASLDGINLDMDTIIEIKVSKHTFNKLVNDEIPDNYYYQIQHQMMVFDSVDQAYLVAYNPETQETAYSTPITPDMEYINDIKSKWEEFDKEKDTLKVESFDLSNDTKWLRVTDEYKKALIELEVAKNKVDELKEELQTFWAGAKTFGNGVTISKSKDSNKIKYENIYKDNKELLKDVDISKYQTTKKGSFRVTVK